MTEIEKKALALVNEVRASHGLTPYENLYATPAAIEALCRAIERDEAFRQEVSDAVEGFWNYCRTTNTPFPADLDRFIIAKPDPLDLVADDMMLGAYNPRREWGAELRAAIEKRGGKIVWEDK